MGHWRGMSGILVTPRDRPSANPGIYLIKNYTAFNNKCAFSLRACMR